MKIRNLFRMILVAVGLLMGTNNVQAAETTLWEGTSDGNWWTIDASKFSDVTSTSVLRVYVDGDNRIYLVASSWAKLWDNNDEFQGSPYYDSENTCYKFVVGDASSLLENNGINIQSKGATIYKVTLENAASQPSTPKYTLTINIDGQTSTKRLEEGTKLADVLGTPSKSGYVFTGWDGIPNNGKMPAENLTVTALFRQYILTLDYDKNKGTVTADNTSDISSWQNVNVTVTPAKGYEVESVTFKNSDGSTPNYWNTYTVQFTSFDITCTVTFRKVAGKHTLTISIDGQTTTQQVAEGTKLDEILPSSPTKTGYSFTGWEGIPNNKKMPDADLTVTALFTINSYMLTYKVDGEQYGDVETIEYGAAITPRTEPTKEGYNFSGWQNLPATMPANDVVVTGSFSKDKVYTSISVGSTGYASYCSDKALNFTGSEAVKAYIAKSKNDTEVTLQQVTGAVAPNTGLILCGNSSASANIEVVESGNTYSANLLVGVMSNTTINASNLYVLVNKNGTIKFADTAAQAATVPAGKAYLQTPASSSRMLAVSFENTTTAIKALKTGSSQGSEVYNLNGQRVKHVSKGLYIINGKKVIIK